MSKKIKPTEEQEFRALLVAGGGQCMAEYRVARTTGFARCPEFHLKASPNAVRKGPAYLSILKIGRTKKLFCQWCCQDIIERTRYAGFKPGKFMPVDAAQTILI